MTATISGATLVAGVAGAPVAHSLSPVLHNAWIAAAGLDAVYVAFPTPAGGFTDFARGLRGGVVRGLNVTAPFKETALALADLASDRAMRAGSANLLIFQSDGAIVADNTDGLGLLAAFAEQAPNFNPAHGPVVVLGAGGAGRGAIAALLEAGAPQVRLVNRTRGRAEEVAAGFGDQVAVYELPQWARALEGASAAINATPLGFEGTSDRLLTFESAALSLVAMDMVYRPLRTAFLKQAETRGLTTVDGLAMLIGQAAPCFTGLFGLAPPSSVDVRALVLKGLGAQP